MKIYKLPHCDNEKEIIYSIETIGRTHLSIASNCAYELLVDSMFVGSGGHRCTDQEIYIDEWFDIKATDTVTIRYQWFNYDTCSVWLRRLFPTSIFVDMDCTTEWKLVINTSLKMGNKINSQLAHQYIMGEYIDNPILKLEDTALIYNIIPLPIQKCEYIDVVPKIVSVGKLTQVQRNLLTIIPLMWPHCNDVDLVCETYDLGLIGLHRFESGSDRDIVLYYSEVELLDDALIPLDRGDVQSADGFRAGCVNAPFGTRGCRYVHVIFQDRYDEDVRDISVIKLRAQRQQYPFVWKNVQYDKQYDSLISACRNNLIACVDGGVVDTCWRERTQWTGDARISLMAINCLTDNKEIVEFVLDQIAQSYHVDTGMVEGAYPMKKSSFRCEIPTYHLAFCYAVVEYYGYDAVDNRAYNIMLKSLEFWKNNYIVDGILTGMPGWYFLDWNPEDTLVSDQYYEGAKHPNSVCNAMYWDLCVLLNRDSGINMNRFNELFCWHDHAYTINSMSHANFHATALILSLDSFKQTTIGKEYMLDMLEDMDMIKNTVTPYFAFFVAKALKYHYPERFDCFVDQYYVPIADRHGTVYEKTDELSSMAHGWSVGIATLLI